MVVRVGQSKSLQDLEAFKRHDRNTEAFLSAQEVSDRLSVRRRSNSIDVSFPDFSLFAAVGRNSPEAPIKTGLKIDPLPIRRGKSGIAAFQFGNLNLIAAVGIH